MNRIRTITQKTPKSIILGFLKPRYYTTISQESSPKSPPSDKIISIADEITTLTLLEVSDLTSLLSKKLQIKEMPLVFPMIPGMGINFGGGVGGGGGGAAAAAEKVVEEKTVFDLKLEAGFDAGAKIKIIKEVRTFTDLGLKEAKELVEKAPAVLKTGVGKEEGEKIVEKMKAIGATVVMA